MPTASLGSNVWREMMMGGELPVMTKTFTKIRKS